MKILDISQEIFSCRIYPGDPAAQIHRLCSMNQGDVYNLSSFSMCAHNGTHLDAPAHFLKDGATIDRIDLRQVVGLCSVIHHSGLISAEDALKIVEKARKSGASERILISGDATVTLEAARIFSASGLVLIGNESQSVGPIDAPMAVHLELLKAQIVLLEGLVLNHVPEGVYFLSAAPLLAYGMEGSPCRAYLIDIEKNTRVD